ncbi:putative toprim domain-containing protein [Vibrio phage 150E35-1]|nr:putative toprim domain-containing protein [Vibrio phage 150E35-1]
MNTTTTTIEEMLENNEMKSMFNVIGAGIHPYNVDMDAARYGKFVLFADEDADGKQICALLLGALGTYLPQAVQMGMVYIVDAPLYKQDGKYYRSSEKDQLNEKKDFERYKGLGAMDPDDIGDVAFSLDHRRLIQVTPEGLEKAVELVATRHAKKKLVTGAGLVEEPREIR